MLPEQVLVDPALLLTAREIGWRLDAPFHFRLIMQPLMAVLLGVRDGRLDAKAGTPPFLYDLIFSPADRQAGLRGAFDAIWKPFAVATLMDLFVQYTFLDSVSIPGGLLIGGVLIGVPYALSRGLSNRLARQRERPGSRPGAE